MGNDLPDYQTQVVGVGLEATSFRSGLDADKPASPAAGDIWLARDTYYLYVCNVAGAWEKVTKLYLLLAGGTMSGAIAMGSNKITGLAAPTANADAARKLDVDTVDAKLDDFSVAQPTRAIGTTYQNTGGKIRLVSVTIDVSSGYVQALCDANSTPTTVVAYTDAIHAITLTFLVPPNYYYKLNKSGTATSANWTEWDEH